MMARAINIFKKKKCFCELFVQLLILFSASEVLQTTLKNVEFMLSNSDYYLEHVISFMEILSSARDPITVWLRRNHASFQITLRKQ